MSKRKSHTASWYKRKSTYTLGAAAIGLMMTVAGCGTASNTNSSTGSSSNSQPTPGGTITFAVAPQTNLDWFFPISNAAADSVANFQLIYQMYKPLIWIDNNYNINWNSSIASKITYNKKGTVYHVFLNPKWHWSNGQPITSKDVLFSWNVIKAASANNAPNPWPYVGVGTGDIPNGVASVVANSPYEVTFTLDKPANQHWFIYNGLIQIIPMPASAWNKYPNNITEEIKYLGANATNPMFDSVVDGPFMMKNAVPNQSWTLVPNPKYDGHKSIIHKLIFAYEASNAAEFSALESGTVNVGYLDLSQYGSRQALLSKGYTITPEYSFGYYNTQLNMFPGAKTAPIFDQLYIRQAIDMGIDRNAIDQSVFHGYGAPAYGPIPTVPKTQFLDPTLTHNPYPYNPAAGKKLLEEHGWHEVNGVMTKGNQKLKFTMLYVSGTTSGQDEAELMVQGWAQEGIQVTLKPMPFSTLISVTSNPKDPNSWQMATGSGWFYNGPGFYPTGGQLYATNAPSGFGYSNPEEDALIAATHQPYSTDAQNMKAFFAYEEFTAKQLPIIWNNNVATLVVSASNVHNVQQYYNGATDFPQMQYWWVSGQSNSSN
ncbi:peptide ABC transporter substrate-binding protein [Alicyclobacillus tolerans]|uniref:Peptide/nickel transport system substrate-binding protein n=2 Tax=Alicyclobacillus tolerans TaxID=90970 RepID=A0ABT9LTT2_9BACL|nr:MULTISPECIES: peptide ABC transporter substrate-binding protein [Alicyclobacillus]MDP9727668.1 peptide/nickel transport system substrate-binding protein [Alicyclobacillus tengchongensis]SHJ62067.1 peptide/nickel transport system substrate-binding protein [Alicyclobacillus montanus]